MKTLIPVLLLAIFPVVSFAQERRAPRPSSTTTRRTAPIPSNTAQNQSQFLKENITLKLEGNFQGFAPLSIALTGNGREFTTDLTTKPGKDDLAPTIITFSVQVSPDSDENYQVSYSLGARIAVPSSTYKTKPNGPVMTNIEYRNISLSGNAKLTQGKPLVISKQNGETLSLAITKPKIEE